MAKIAHVVGNGPSRLLFNDVDAGKRDVVVAHNIPEAGIDADVIVVIDSQPIEWMAKQKIYPAARFWVSNRSHNMIKNHGMLDKIKIETVWPDVHRYNAGIYSVRECLNRQWDVHMWGFDSMFSDSLESPAMDRIIARHRRPKHLDKQWQDHWIKVFNDRNNNIHVHMPNDAVPKIQLTSHDCITLHKH
tara:strand:- start:493 stop:1059 length:567 start_codon:yes stop_codon:yes gene_type:complete